MADSDRPLADERSLNWVATTCRALLANDFIVRLLAADFTQPLTFCAVLLMPDFLRRRLAMAAPTNPPARAAAVVAPATFTDRLRPFLRLALLADLLEVLDFISSPTTSLPERCFN
jgi:hypothetical protein